MAELDFTRFDAVTFDCYGTLIDWEQGILNALQPVLAPRGVERDEEELLQLYARHEAALEAGDYPPTATSSPAPWRGLCEELGFRASAKEEAVFARALGEWPAFPDTAAALRRLRGRFRLGVITNCDRDLFALSTERLGGTFDWVVTAEDARAYKPSLAPFELAFRTIDVPRERILHVGAEPVPRSCPGRRARAGTTPGGGATPPASPRSDRARPEDARRRRARRRRLAGHDASLPGAMGPTMRGRRERQ